VASGRDVEKTVSYWADDAFMMSAGQPALKGKQAIRQMVMDSYKIPGFQISWQPQSVEVSESGDMAYLIENSQVSFTDSTGKVVTQHNKAVSIWRKQSDGTWKNVVDISTPDAQQNP
jgi:ketosteroid isomerase-like protein